MPTIHRTFWRCNTCLAVMATEPGQTPANSPNNRVLCSCGGFAERMGVVLDTSHRAHESTTVCDGRCTAAKGPDCNCQCGGSQHGIGCVVEMDTTDPRHPQLKSPKPERAKEFQDAKAAALAAFDRAHPGARDAFGVSYLPRPTWDAVRSLREEMNTIKNLKTHSKRLERLKAIVDRNVGAAVTSPPAMKVTVSALPEGSAWHCDNAITPDVIDEGARRSMEWTPVKPTAGRVWSTQQLAIFDAGANPSGHFAVVARAGCGKTTTAIEMLRNCPEVDQIYVAFNRRNVDEAKAKIKSDTEVMSLNGLGYRYVLENWRGVKPDDLVEWDRVRAVDRDAPASEIVGLVSYAKNTMPCVPSYEALLELAKARGVGADDYSPGTCASIARKVMVASTKRDPQNRITFTDQLWLPVVMGWVRPRFDLVVVDEAQDLNWTQIAMVKGAVRPTGRICLIGDPRQSLYGFRGAAPGGMEKTIAELGAKTYPLTTTYRCPKSVVSLAQRLVPDYQVAPSAPEGVVRAGALASEIEGLVPGDAVLSRLNAPLVRLCLEVLKRGVTAHVEGRDVSKGLTAVLKKLKCRTTAELAGALEAWLERQLGRLGEGQEDQGDLLRDQKETLVALSEGLQTVAELETRIQRLFSDSDGNSRPSVTFSSVHRAKGREFTKVVVLAATLRSDWSDNETQEHNITYVAATRSMSELIWVTDSVPGVRNGTPLHLPREVEQDPDHSEEFPRVADIKAAEDLAA